jgi:SAM-dependent methyltransferase
MNAGHPAGRTVSREEGRDFRHFDGDVAVYDAAKPLYPNELITRIVATMPGRDIVNVGCGTGIEARQFQAAGCTVLGVDPDERMAQFARGTGVQVEASKFETWAPAGRMFDAVVAGTAWHWVDPVAGVAKAAQVLRPGGLLAPFHHAQHTPPELEAVGDGLPAWSSRAADAYQRVAPSSVLDSGGRRRSSKELYQLLFDEFANQVRQAGGFSEPEQWQFGWERTYTRDEWLELLPTYGAVAKLPPDELAGVLEHVGTVIDGMGGRFSLPFTTVAVVAVREDAD